MMEDIRKKMLAEIRRDMNGAVVEAMRDMIHGEPFFSYGVSVVKIKESSAPYSLNHDLALYLFQTKIRELKLSAIYIEDPAKITREQMNDWKESFCSLEIAEHASSMLFYKSKFALEIAEQWLKDSNEFVVKAACLMIDKRARVCFDICEVDRYKELSKMLLELSSKTTTPIVLSGVVMALSSIANSDKNIGSYLSEKIFPQLSESLNEELIWRLKY